MVTNHNKHNSAWNFLTIEGIGSPCCRRLLEASLNWGTEKLLPFVPSMLASRGHHPTTLTDQKPRSPLSFSFPPVSLIWQLSCSCPLFSPALYPGSQQA